MFQPYFARDDTCCKGRGIEISGNEESIASNLILGVGVQNMQRDI